MKIRPFVLNSLLLILLLGVLFLAALAWMTQMPGHAWEGRSPSADLLTRQMAVTLQQHVQTIARVPHHAQELQALQQVQTYLTEKLTDLGYEVKTEAVPGGLAPVYNLVVELPPQTTGTRQPRWLVIGAHYDSVPDGPGADDNGSGVAALLVLADQLRTIEPARQIGIRMIFYVNEEDPYFQTATMGSLVNAQLSTAKAEQLIGMLSLETIGYFSDTPGSQHFPWPFSWIYPDTGDYIALVGDLSARQWVSDVTQRMRMHAQIPIHGGVAPAWIEGVDWSDHWSYSQHGVPALMVTDTAPNRNPHFHTANDTVDTLDYVRLAYLVKALHSTVQDLVSVSTGRAESFKVNPVKTIATFPQS